MSGTSKQEYWVVYDYGQGGLWASVSATSAHEIEQRFRQIKVFAERPEWMDDELAKKLVHVDVDNFGSCEWLSQLAIVAKG